MKFLRAFTVVLSFFIFGIGASILSFILFPLANIFLKKENRKAYFVNTIHKSWGFFVGVITALKVMKADFSFLNKMKDIKGKVIVANHPSYIDIVILIGKIPNCVSVVKAGILSNFFMRNIVSNAYLINDEDLENFKKDAKALLNNGFNIVIFPTGTRTLLNEEVKLHSGAAAIALDNNAEIIPFKILQSEPFLVKNQSIFNSLASKCVEYKIIEQASIKPSDIIGDNSSSKARKIICEKIKESCFK